MKLRPHISLVPQGDKVEKDKEESLLDRIPLLRKLLYHDYAHSSIDALRCEVMIQNVHHA